jgi:hypothetical protein
MAKPTWTKPLFGLLFLALAGCAPAYHQGLHGCISCRYCPPAPLPYRLYDDCGCHSQAADAYLGLDTARLTRSRSHAE